ncbi:hypothetical protein MesoLjLc_19760 [Mesorhizobium sp. L-8-10]|uniref:hypothetical protein n=1 Tax=Mesorhizobium sp. L-8-10 TaxID=2744523 RepID=UPI0019290D00|nr:hypothetical protein [Mesorhizobium sp. L-8-10]BCH30046.1 hypothetical protein MesoLjLc_19760 [Mesorhizobium sp. L-8-10]
MPDGRPGDHPLTDISIHGEEIFDRETNARIRRLVNGAPPHLLEILDDLVWHWPRPRNHESDWGELINADDFARVIEGLERAWRNMAGGRD